MTGWKIFPGPGYEDQDRAPVQPAYQICQEIYGSLIRPLRVIQKEYSRRIISTKRQEHLSETLKKPDLSTRAIERDILRSTRTLGAQLGQQACGLVQPQRWYRLRPILPGQLSHGATHALYQ